MKPAPFSYHAVRRLDDAVRLLGEFGDDAKLLAGGQSLVPLMNFRLARPAHVIDLNRVGELAYLRVEDGELCIGAMTRQREVEQSPLVAERWPLLTAAVRQIGHVQIRNRGTVGGSLAHADPAAELPAAVTVLGGTVVVRNRTGSRALAAEQFFLRPLTTALAPDEVLIEVRIPPARQHTGSAFQEVSRRQGDFALVGVAAAVTVDEAGLVVHCRLVFTGVGPRPVRSRVAEAMLEGARLEPESLRRATRAAAEELQPDTDIHAGAEYRREVGAVLACRALAEAAARATRAVR
jgi:aerobic carbon-monoxide dehydrogenase medium subunit